MTMNTGKFVTVSMDVEYKENIGWIAEGTQLEVANVWKQYDGFTPVIVKSIKDHRANKDVEIEPTVAYYMNETFSN